MKKSLTILALLFCVTTFISAQTKKQTDKSKSITADTTLANEYFNIGEKYSSIENYDSSSMFFLKSGDIYEKYNFWEKRINCYNKIADNLRQIGKNDSAIKLLKTCIDLGEKKIDKKNLEIARCYGNIGINYRVIGEYQQALYYYQTALDIRNQLLDKYHPDIAISYNNIGNVLGDLGKYQQAIEFLLIALDISMKNYGEKNRNVVSNLISIGTIYYYMGMYKEATSFLKKAMKIGFDVYGINHSTVANIHNNIGLVYKNEHHYDDAIKEHKKALLIRKNIFGEFHPSVSHSYNNLAIIYDDIGDYIESLEYQNKAIQIRILNFGEDNVLVAESYFNKASVLAKQGNLNSALDYHNKSLDIYLKNYSENHPYIAEAYLNIGGLYALLNNLDKALEYLNSSLSIYQNTVGENHSILSSVHVNIATIERKKGSFLRAYSECLKALNIIRNNYLEPHPAYVSSYLELGDIYLIQDKVDSALLYYQKSICSILDCEFETDIYNTQKITQATYNEDLLEVIISKANACKIRSEKSSNSLRDLQTSLSTYELASELIDKIRHGYKAEGSKLFLGKKAAEIYENAIQAALTMYDVTKDNQYKEKAFFFAEKNRANVLLDAMADSRAKSFGDIPDSLLEAEKNLKIDLSFYDTQIQREQEKGKDQDSAKIAEYQDKSFDLNRQYQALIDTLEKRYPRYYELKYQAAVSSVSDIQKNLDDKTALIEYFTGDSNLYIFTITKNDFHVHSSAKDTSFNSLVRRFYGSIRKSDRADYAATNYEMYKKLISPVEKRISKKEKWIVIPDGPLYYAPFEAIIVKPVKSDNYASLPYLVKERDIRYHYSATLWNRTPERKPAYEYEFAGFAPVFSDTVKNGVMIGTNFSVLDTMNPGVAYRSVERGSNAFRALPKSRDELSAIVRAFESRKKSAVAYLHREASEEHFKARAASSRILHVATHGLINEKKPKLSALAFSQPEDSLAKDDGLLYAGEIYNLRSAAELVVLSSCESGLGEVVRGEGMMALTRGFIYAGADHIVTSLWKVLDDNAHALMTAMYAEMLSGRSYSESLRKAKLAMIKNPQTCAPSQWSAFVLFGK